MPIEDTQQVTHRQHAVPQNIMDVEFKIIGDLTMRQFFYLMIFGGLAYVIFTQVGSAIKYPIVLGLVGIGVVLAFIPFEERTMDEWIVNFFRAIFQENQAIWRKSPETISAFAYEDLNVMKQELITLTPTSSRRKLEEYLDSQTRKKPHDPLDIQDSVFIKKVRDAFYKEAATVTQTTVLPKPQERAPYVQVLPQQPQHEPLPSRGPKIGAEGEEKAEIEKREEAGRPQEPAGQVPAEVETGPPPSVPTAPMPPQPQPQPEQPAEIVKRDTSGMAGIQLPPREYQPLEPITPDKHTGRIFTSLLPKEGEIVLPIKRERILKSSEEKEIEEDIKEKTDQLKELIDRMKTEESPGTPTQEPTPLPIKQEKLPEKPVGQVEQKEEKKEKPKEEKKEKLPEKPPEPIIIREKVIDKESTETLKKLKNQNENLKKEINKLEKEIAGSKNDKEKTEKKAKLQKLEKEVAETEKNYISIKDGLKSLTDVFSKKEKVEPEEKIPTDKVQGKPPEPSKINIVSGAVQDNSGTNLEGIVLIIKSEKGEPVRAIKTNKIGRFVISTPLTNGNYTIETDKSKKTDLTFDIINIEAKGGEIPEVIIKGKR